MDNNYYAKGFMYYINGFGCKIKAYVKNSNLTIRSERADYEAPILKLITTKAGSAALNIRTLGKILDSIPDSDVRKALNLTDGPRAKKNTIDIIDSLSLPSRPIENHNRFTGYRNSEDFYNESLTLDLHKIPFVNKSIIDDIQIIVDHRERDELYHLFNNSIIPSENVFLDTLEMGDIKVIHLESLNELIIERKKITDLKRSIISNHAHDQMARYTEYIDEKAENGIHIKFVWMIESENEGRLTIFNALDTIQQMEGWVNFTIAIEDQFMHGTFSPRHTAYSTLKMCQGFFEREIVNKVKVQRANIINKHRVMQRTDEGDKGVYRSKNNLKTQLMFLHGVKTNVAEEFSLLGKSYRDIINMSKEEIAKVKGVGPKSVDVIYDTFNLTE